VATRISAEESASLSPAGGSTVAYQEKIMRKSMIVLATIGVLAFLPALVCAQQPLADGEVTKVDESAGKITIKHGPIKKLNMDEGMTMVFKASDPAMLKQVKPGDKIKFDADNVNGQFTVTKIEKKK
jgi:Cu(I)/Ag(I) efflux system protein CusF